MNISHIKPGMHIRQESDPDITYVVHENLGSELLAVRLVVVRRTDIAHASVPDNARHWRVYDPNSNNPLFERITK